MHQYIKSLMSHMRDKMPAKLDSSISPNTESTRINICYDVYMCNIWSVPAWASHLPGSQPSSGVPAQICIVANNHCHLPHRLRFAFVSSV